MPELPDEETFRRYLDSTALHQRIREVAVHDAAVLRNVSARSLQTRLKGHEFKSTHRHGKNLFAEVTGRTERLLLRFGMTGVLAYYKEPDQAPAHARVVFHFTNDYELACDNMRKIGKVSLVDHVPRYLCENGIGPDALELTEEAFHERLEGRKGSIKSALMDQQLLAGIGNVYADELLLHSRRRPATTVEKLGRAGLKKIYRAMRAVLEKAVKCQADIDRFPSSWLLPHRNTEDECPRCCGAWQRIKVSGRTTFLCPHFQKRKPPSSHA